MYVLPPLSAFPKDFIENWIGDYLTSVPSAKREILKQYFPSLKEPSPVEGYCQTEKIEMELRRLFNKLNKEDPTLLELLDT
ncbi:MAG: hypothetical protein LH606_02920 [Cytophagaceae bacterium]|nr:hypothetical protein [Cytophagaceae bacterium]